MDESLLSKMVEKVHELPFHRFMGIKVDDYGKGSCRLRFSVTENTRNAFGAVHGGIYYSVLDLAAFIASASVAPDDRLLVTSDINVSVLSAVHEGELTVRAKVLKMGKRVCFIESRAFDKDDNLVAIARVTKSVIPLPQMAELPR